jgi:hypothetical protein
MPCSVTPCFGARVISSYGQHPRQSPFPLALGSTSQPAPRLITGCRVRDRQVRPPKSPKVKRQEGIGTPWLHSAPQRGQHLPPHDSRAGSGVELLRPWVSHC